MLNRNRHSVFDLEYYLVAVTKISSPLSATDLKLWLNITSLAKIHLFPRLTTPIRSVLEVVCGAFHQNQSLVSTPVIYKK